MKHIDISSGDYACKWSLTDFYDDSEQKLRDALASGEDFDTGWFSCNKEPRSARYVRRNGWLSVEVSAAMSDLWEQDDLIYGALWSISRSEPELPEDVISLIRDTAIDLGLDDVSYESEMIPAPVSYTKLVEVTDRLEKEVESNNDRMFNQLREIVKEVLKYRTGLCEGGNP